MADGNGAVDGGQSIGRGSGERPVVGLVSRFIGAVFLVLLGGLLMLDRALQRANHDQAQLDTQAAGLLTEIYVVSRVQMLDLAAALAGGPAKDSAARRAAAARLMAAMPDVRAVWATDGAGRPMFDISADQAAGARALPSPLAAELRARRVPPRTVVSVIGPAAAGQRARVAWVALLRGLAAGRGGSDSGTVGLVFDGDALAALLARTPPSSRRSLAVVSGADTVVRIGAATETGAAAERAFTIVRLPNGGTWRVTSTHALTTRGLRWGVWALGVFGVVFLAVGLLREQQRAAQVADRSLELERLYSDVKRANQAKSEFLANISHELRTPLNAIVGFVELLRDGFYGDLSPRQVPPVDRIAASATHLRHLVDQVLDIAKIAAGRLEVHPETIVLRPFVLNIASELESLVSEKGLAFSITVGASLPRVRTDPTHLRQILINLIGNAVKYTPAGTVSVRARLLGAPPEFNARMTPIYSTAAVSEERVAATLLTRAPRSGTWVALQVVDSGVGIAPSDLERIFDEFEQVNAGPRGESMQRGTGLGLAISRRLARLIGGDITVESELGRGATFTVWLPVTPADLTRERPGAASTPAPAAGPGASA